MGGPHDVKFVAQGMDKVVLLQGAKSKVPKSKVRDFERCALKRVAPATAGVLTGIRR